MAILHLATSLLFAVLSTAVNPTLSTKQRSNSTNANSSFPLNSPVGPQFSNVTSTNMTTSSYGTSTDTLYNTLYDSSSCIKASHLGSEFKYYCYDLAPGNYQFQVCREQGNRYAMQCNVTSKGHYNYRVVGYNGFEQSGCYGSDCFSSYCQLRSGNIIFSTVSEQDALMVLTTQWTTRYTSQLRHRLEAEGFLTYPAPDNDVATTWCNAKTILKVSKDAVDRAHLGFLVYRCDAVVNCSMPSQDTIRLVRDILEDEYPSLEVGLRAGLVLGIFAVICVLVCWCCGCFSKCCVSRRKPVVKSVRERGGGQAAMAQANGGYDSRPPPYAWPVLGLPPLLV